MATYDAERVGSAPWLLTGPALLVFLTLLAAPLVLTAMLSLNLFSDTKGVIPVYSLANYLEVFGDDYFHEIFLRTGGMALAVTICSVLIGVPETLIIARMRAPWRSLFLLVVLGPLLISVVVRTLGWAILLGNNGLINQALQALGIIDFPIRMMFTQFGVVLALTHVLVPFMVISVWASLQRINPATEAAALSLGASQFTVIRRVIVPQVMPGILSGAIMVFAMAASSFATPAIIGGRRLKNVATAAYDEFLNTLNWPLGAALAVVLLVATVVVLLSANRIIERRYGAVFNQAGG